MIGIKGVRKHFARERVAALQDIDLEIGSNEFFTLLGPSGCGKSTLLRCLAGLEVPDAGQIQIAGNIVFSSADRIIVSPNRRNIGMVFQSYAIWPHMTVLSNVAFPLEVRHKLNANHKATKAIEMVGLGGLEKRYAAQLSGGQQQRVALARAIVADPDVLLLDEPLSNLDAGLREQMRGELLRIQRDLKMTTIFVTHDQTEALTMSDRIGVMCMGQLVEIATPEALYKNPMSAFAAQFIGVANILEANAVALKGGGCLVETAVGVFRSNEAAHGQVQVFIRPENIEFYPDANAINVIELTALSRRFAGDMVEYDLVSPSSDKNKSVFRARISESKATVQPGNVCSVHIPASKVRIFPPSGVSTRSPDRQSEARMSDGALDLRMPEQ